uniref:Secreted protein n=1 Tax=Octopus bimaculoides TaxID=37653 RepID=A0A0L8GQF9_OCTBM
MPLTNHGLFVLHIILSLAHHPGLSCSARSCSTSSSRTSSFSALLTIIFPHLSLHHLTLHFVILSEEMTNKSLLSFYDSIHQLSLHFHFTSTLLHSSTQEVLSIFSVKSHFCTSESLLRDFAYRPRLTPIRYIL